ncbi:MAG: DUF992 domain-containing protein, partial [Candidatus Binatia bacterium]
MMIRDKVVALVCGFYLLFSLTDNVLAQDARLVAGTLTCRGNGSVGLILGSSQRMSCEFQ